MRKLKYGRARAFLAALLALPAVITLSATEASAAQEFWQYTAKLEVLKDTQLAKWYAKCPAGSRFKGTSVGGFYPAHYAMRTNLFVHVLNEGGAVFDEVDKTGQQTGRQIIMYIINNSSGSQQAIRLKYQCEAKPGHTVSAEAQQQKFPDLGFDCNWNTSSCSVDMTWGQPYWAERGVVHSPGANTVQYNCGVGELHHTVGWEESVSVGLSSSHEWGFDASLGKETETGLGAEVSFSYRNSTGRSWTSSSGWTELHEKYNQPMHYGWWTGKVGVIDGTGTARLVYANKIEPYSDQPGQSTNNRRNEWTGTITAQVPNFQSNGFVASTASYNNPRMTAQLEKEHCAEGIRLSTPEHGKQYILNERVSLNVLDVYGGLGDAGTAIQLYPEKALEGYRNDGDSRYNQYWIYEETGPSDFGPTFRLKSVASSAGTGMCMTVGSDTVRVTQQPCNGSTAQRFYLTPAGNQFYHLHTLLWPQDRYVVPAHTDGKCKNGAGYNLFVWKRPTPTLPVAPTLDNDGTTPCGQFGFRKVTWEPAP